MDPAQWKRVNTIFTAVAGVDPEHRAHALVQLCPDDEQLRRDVWMLLEAHDQTGFVDELAARLQALAPTGAAPPVTPDRIGRYEVVGQIGRGGMGVVWQARDPALDRMVAVKLIAPGQEFDEAGRRRLLAEARAAAAIDHPSVATIYEIGETGEGRVFLAMAFYEGETLAARLARGPMPIGEAIATARQIAAGLAAAHARNITHRDLKPANVLLTTGGAVKLLDFGIAKMGGVDDTLPGQLFGTTACMAPEQWRGDRADARTDVWAFGLVLYEMLTGERPLPLGRDGIVSADSALRPSARRPDVPPAVDQIVERALRVRPDDRQHDGAELVAAFDAMIGSVPPGGGRERIGRVPVPIASFCGREREVDEIAARLEHARLLTLIGPGGAGKTRLSQQVAITVAARYADGVAYVSLGSTSDPALVTSEIARALGAPERPAVPAIETLASFIGRRRLLLVLDNFEHVVLAAAAVSRLLSECAHLQVLVTSRAPLKVSGEHEYPVPPLLSPPPGTALSAADLDAYPATALFVDRLRAVRPDFVIADEEAAAIAELCRRLDGLPLAIELAAARGKLFSPRAMLARLDQRFELLSDGGRDRPVRHHSLRHAIAWSYELLTPEERALFRRLAVFIGGCGIDDTAAVAQALASDGAEVLARAEALVDHHLVLHEYGPGGLPRLRTLETIREFALERLQDAGEAAAAQRAHAIRFLSLAEEAEPHLTGPDQAAWFDRLEVEHANLRGALSWAQRTGDAVIALRFGTALWRFWAARGYLVEGRERLEQLLAMPGAKPRTSARARALHGAATLIHQISEYRAARPLAEECLAIGRELGDQRLIVTALNSLSWILVRTGDGAAAEAICEEALAVNRQLADPRGLAVALHNLGWLAACRGEFDRSCALHEESVTCRRAHRDPRGLAFGMTQLAWAEINRGRLTPARQLLAEARATFERLGDRQLLAWALSIEGILERAAAHPATAAERYAESLTLWRAVGNLFGIAFSLVADAELALDAGERDRAAHDLDEALPIVRRIGECWGLAWALTVRARLAQADGEQERAAASYAESLALWQRIGNRHAADACRAALHPE